MASCWDFIAFGTMYASQFTLIHSEYLHPWDHFYEVLGIGTVWLVSWLTFTGTAAYHNVHHSVFVWNYGHFFEYWDRIFGTFKSPHEVQGFTTNTQRKLGLNTEINLSRLRYSPNEHCTYFGLCFRILDIR